MEASGLQISPGKQKGGVSGEAAGRCGAFRGRCDLGVGWRRETGAEALLQKHQGEGCT